MNGSAATNGHGAANGNGANGHAVNGNGAPATNGIALVTPAIHARVLPFEISSDETALETAPCDVCGRQHGPAR